MNEVEKISLLWDYIDQRMSSKATTKFMAHFSLDNIHYTKTRSLEQLKGMVDNILLLRGVLK